MQKVVFNVIASSLKFYLFITNQFLVSITRSINIINIFSSFLLRLFCWFFSVFSFVYITFPRICVYFEVDCSIFFSATFLFSLQVKLFVFMCISCEQIFWSAKSYLFVDKHYGAHKIHICTSCVCCLWSFFFFSNWKEKKSVWFLS